MTLPRVAVGAMARLYLLANTHDTTANFPIDSDNSQEHEISCPSFADARKPPFTSSRLAYDGGVSERLQAYFLRSTIIAIHQLLIWSFYEKQQDSFYVRRRR